MERINVLSQATPNMSGTSNNPLNIEQIGKPSAVMENSLDFLALLKLIGLVSEAKGQSSEVQSDNSEDPFIIDQNTTSVGIGINDFGLAQYLQSYVPVGKDANTGGLLSDAAKLNIAKTSGMIPTELLGDLSPKGEVLDKYRSTIINLLGELSGKIIEVPVQGDLKQPLMPPKQLQNDIVFNLRENTLEEVINSDSKLPALSTLTTTKVVSDIQNKFDGKIDTQIAQGEKGLNLEQNIDFTTKTTTKFSEISVENGKVSTDTNKIPTELNKVSVDTNKISTELNKISMETNKISIEPNKVPTEPNKVPTEPNKGLVETSNNLLMTDISQRSADLLQSVNKADIPEILNQISSNLRQNLLGDKKEVRQFEIQLHPAELGNIKISLRWDNGQVHLQIQASEISTGSNIQQNLSQLRQQLESMGIPCGSMQMGQGQGNFGWQQPQQNFQQKGQDNEGKKEFFTETYPNTIQTLNKDHLINVTA